MASRDSARTRVAGVVVTPPGYKASGGVSAALQLMTHVARVRDTRVFVMSDRDEDVALDGLRISYRRSSNVVRPFRRALPREVVTLMWRARLHSWLRDWHPDVVHLHNPHPPGALAQVARTCDRLGIPYVISTHGFVEFDNYSAGFSSAAWMRPLLRMLVRTPVVRVARGARRVLMLSPLEEQLLVGMGVNRERLSVVPNGVDPYFLEDPKEGEEAQLRERLRLPGNRPLLLFVGNHTANKGIDVLLDAAKRMKVGATIVVSGAIRSVAAHQRLLSAAGLARNDPRVVFTDFVSKPELRVLYRLADVFVFPSRADTFPLVVLEAMASGLPVIASAVGGIPYQLSSESGVLIEPGNPEALAAAADRLCADAEARRRMGAAARDRVRRMFQWKRSAELAIEAYDRIAPGGAA